VLFAEMIVEIDMKDFFFLGGEKIGTLSRIQTRVGRRHSWAVCHCANLITTIYS